jgi:hypothetical protein
MDDTSAFFMFIFILEPILIASCSCICNIKSLCNQIYDYKIFNHVRWRIIALVVAKMVDLDTSCKWMGWMDVIPSSDCGGWSHVSIGEYNFMFLVSWHFFYSLVTLSVKGGCEVVVHGVQVTLDVHPNWVVL